jgi:hypothetical protein
MCDGVWCTEHQDDAEVRMILRFLDICPVDGHLIPFERVGEVMVEEEGSG